MQTFLIDLGADLVKPYNFENQITDQMLELRHGKDTKLFPMDKVSNSPFTDVRSCRLTFARAYNCLSGKLIA